MAERELRLKHYREVYKMIYPVCAINGLNAAEIAYGIIYLALLTHLPPVDIALAISSIMVIESLRQDNG